MKNTNVATTVNEGILAITTTADNTIRIGEDITLAEFKLLRSDLAIANLYITDMDGGIVDCSIVVDFKDKPKIAWVGDTENFFLAINSIDEDYNEDFEKVVVEVMLSKMKKLVA